MRLTVGASPEDVCEIRDFVESILKVGDEELGEANDGEAILAPTNEVVDTIKDHLLNKFPGEKMVYLSCDNIDKTERGSAIDEAVFSPEFINGLKFSGVPNHRLTLKVGVLIMTPTFNASLWFGTPENFSPLINSGEKTASSMAEPRSVLSMLSQLK
nr:ATP-dependent DNA helicase PIF1-like [Tanacetum cinerariifolium]